MTQLVFIVALLQCACTVSNMRTDSAETALTTAVSDAPPLQAASPNPPLSSAHSPSEILGNAADSIAWQHSFVKILYDKHTAAIRKLEESLDYFANSHYAEVKRLLAGLANKHPVTGSTPFAGFSMEKRSPGSTQIYDGSFFKELYFAGQSELENAFSEVRQKHPAFFERYRGDGFTFRSAQLSRSAPLQYAKARNAYRGRSAGPPAPISILSLEYSIPQGIAAIPQFYSSICARVSNLLAKGDTYYEGVHRKVAERISNNDYGLTKSESAQFARNLDSFYNDTVEMCTDLMKLVRNEIEATLQLNSELRDSILTASVAQNE
ncbi:hypothetical protein PAPHI01_0269 [Pancytospora philotis]|nr:hypothetical protein PAPHI01_0269 [Pancytospora philotis]